MNPIKYETALLLREKMLSHNFSIYGEYAYCLNTNELVRYIEDDKFCPLNGGNILPNDNDHYFTPAPLQEEVIDWLWNEHKICIETPIFVDFFNYTNFYFGYLINCLRDDKVVRDHKIYKKLKDRNEAMEQGIMEALKLIKNK